MALADLGRAEPDAVAEPDVDPFACAHSHAYGYAASAVADAHARSCASAGSGRSTAAGTDGDSGAAPACVGARVGDDGARAGHVR